MSVDPDAEEPVQCTRTDHEPDLVLEIDTLGAAYLGGVSFSSFAAAGRVRELRPGSVRRADAMFSTAEAPYCVTMF